MRKIYFILSILFCQILNAQIQIGQDIDGENVWDRSGSSVAYSEDGNIVAIGAPRPAYSSGNDPGPGSVKVYSYNGSSWGLMGQKLEGDINFSNEFGASVDLSADGLILAVGSPGGSRVNVYHFVNGAWVLLGASIEVVVDFQTGQNAYFGGKVSLSANGHIITVGASGLGVDLGSNNASGYVRSYQYNITNQTWELLGQQIEVVNPVNVPDRFGYDVSLSADGSRFATILRSPSMAKIYEYDGSQWQQMGGDIVVIIHSDGAIEELSNVRITDDGLTIALGIGYDLGDIPNSDEGAVQVYTFDGTDWIQKGQNLYGVRYEGLGTSISFSNDGNILAVGSEFNDADVNFHSYNIGSVRLFNFENEEWQTIGDVIYGESYADRSGNSIALSGDGTRIAIGAYHNDADTGDAGSENGHVRVYDISSAVLNVLENEGNNTVSISPNPTKDIISISSTIHIQSIQVYSVIGKLLFEQKNNLKNVNLKSYPDGLFFIKINSKNGTVLKKVIKKS
ncbi:T9SS type A sorting domain-containing protein [Lacinutrix himadriensis]|uniref:T9SS type A sorting domain-containing protein n=1 Tax=Lacinutrix himadriensis TaxID=641549 RepID=UPI0006E1ED80|nr:T9SS type A sorting domain-containing protein [Lacinutrix himadriensis]